MSRISMEANITPDLLDHILESMTSDELLSLKSTYGELLRLLLKATTSNEENKMMTNCAKEALESIIKERDKQEKFINELPDRCKDGLPDWFDAAH